MAQDQIVVECNPDTYTQLTNSDVTDFSFQVLSGDVEVRFTAGETQPTASARGCKYRIPKGEINKSIADMVQLSGANRVWAKSLARKNATVWVDHA